MKRHIVGQDLEAIFNNPAACLSFRDFRSSAASSMYTLGSLGFFLSATSKSCRAISRLRGGITEQTIIVPMLEVHLVVFRFGFYHRVDDPIRLFLCGFLFLLSRLFELVQEKGRQSRGSLYMLGRFIRDGITIGFLGPGRIVQFLLALSQQEVKRTIVWPRLGVLVGIRFQESLDGQLSRWVIADFDVQLRQVAASIFFLVRKTVDVLFIEPSGLLRNRKTLG